MHFRIVVLLLVALSASIASAADLTVSTAPESNVAFVNGGWEPSGPATGNVNVTTLVTALSSQLITLRASGDVFFQNPVSWASANTLRVEAGGNVILGASLTNLGGAKVVLRADSGGTGAGTVQAGIFNVSAGTVEAFYNPVVFPIPSLLWSGGTSPVAYMLVNTRTNLQGISANLAANYALGRDIDAGGSPFNPLGNAGTPFTGRFEGNGQTIRNLNVSTPANDDGGLFGYASNATIRNVKLLDATVLAANNAGILVGTATNTVTDLVFTSGTVTATNSAAGGVAGAFGGVLSKSASTAAVIAGTNAGGLVGLLANGAAVTNAYATGPVFATILNAGGLVGLANPATITNSYSAGAVTAPGNAGGLAGVAPGATFANCYWDMLTSGQPASAGGTGVTTTQMKQQATFTGWDFATVWSIIAGKTYPYIASLAPVPVTGDLVISTAATSNVTLSNGVFQATATPAVVNVSDLTTALASSNVIVRALPGSGDVAILTPVSWGSAFRLRIEALGDVIVAANITGGASLQLRSELGTIVGPGATSSGHTAFLYNPATFPSPTDFSSFGAVAGFMLVHDRTQLQAIAGNAAGTYALASDLNLGGTPFTPLFTSGAPFTGTFSGDFHAIRGLLINTATSDVGLFRAVLNASIRDLRIENASVTGVSRVGILAGYVLEGVTRVERVVVSGNVTASGSAAGGLVGQSDAADFSQTASSASVTSTGAGQHDFGGAFGLTNPSGINPLFFSESYATGAVNGGTSSTVGGLGGTTNLATGIFQAYSSGAVAGGSTVGGLLGNGAGTEGSAYWDTQASGQPLAGFNTTATGLTTAQMRTEASFVGWDFTNTWTIFESLTSPFLRIEDKAVVSAPPSVIAGTQLTYTFAAHASTLSHENVIPVSFAHAIPAGTALVSTTLPGPMNVPPGWSGTYDVTVAVAPSTTGTLPINATVSTPTFTAPMNATVAVTTLANLSVGVTAAPDPVPAGGTLTYTVTVTNAGPSDATNVVVSQTLPAGVSLIACSAGCTATSIAAGASAVFTITTAVQTSVAAGTTLSATTSALSSTSDPDTTNNSVSTSVTSSVSADLSIAASASAAEAGSSMTWTVTVTNNGPSIATNVNVAHALVGFTCSASCSTATLAPGASVAFTLDGTVPASTLAGTTLSETFTVSSTTADPNASNDSANASAIVTTTADLAATNVVATTSSAGAPVTWTVTITNNGPSDAANVTVSYVPPIGVTGLVCTSSCTAASIAAGANVVFTINGTIDPSTLNGTVVSLTVTAASATSDPQSANDSAAALFTTGTSADLAVSLSGVPSSTTAGTTFPFTIQVTNLGPSDASNVTLSLPAPSSVTFSAIVAPAGWNCTPALTCTMASLPVRMDLISLTAAIDAAAVNGLALTATVTAASADPISSNNSAASDVAVSTLSPISVAITDAPDPVSPSGTITYTITVTNAGPSVATNVPFTIALASGVTATLPATTIATLPVGSQTYVVIADVNAAPGQTLITMVSAGDADASASTTVASPSSLTATKTVSATSFAPSAPVTYTIVITNNGTSTQFDNPGDEMTDVLSSSLTPTDATASAGMATIVGNEVRWNGTLAPGASATVTIHATIAAEGRISNQATLRFDADGNGTNESTTVSNAVTITAANAVPIPTASTWLLLALLAMLALAGWLRS